MGRLRTMAMSLCLGVTGFGSPVSAQDAPLLRPAEVWTGDFDLMLERRAIRVLVPNSRTLYFNDKGQDRGLSAENVHEFELFLNQKYRSKLRGRPLTVTIIPTPRDQLLVRVREGYGDLGVGALTITEQRLEEVDFVAPPELVNISELAITNRDKPPLSSPYELSGREIYVRVSSSYHESLQAWNDTLAGMGLAPVNIIAVSEYLEDEDLMEMVDAGIIPVIIVDSWKARMWAPILPRLRINEDVAVRASGDLGWALRKESPRLTAELKEFFNKFQKERGSIPYRFARYSKQVKYLQDPTGRQDWKHFEQMKTLFETYGQKYGFDPLMLVAQGFQESRLDQDARSHVGAVGVMQVMPATGASMEVGDITVTEPNIHAGAKYMNTILSNYFEDASFDEFNRTLFAFAAYNAGPNRIARLRKLAPDRGLDPNVWFDNVEIIVSEKIGRETTTYVRNILKYYTSYKLTLELQGAAEEARESFGP